MSGKQKKESLSRSDEKFVESVLDGASGADAVRKSGSKSKRPAQRAYELLRTPRIKLAIEERRQMLMTQTGTNKREITGTLISQMRGSVSDYLKDDGSFDLEAVKSYGHLIRKLKITERTISTDVVTKDQDGNITGGDRRSDGIKEVTYQIELYDAQAAAFKLAEIFGLRKPTADAMELARGAYIEMREKYPDIPETKLRKIIAETYNIEPDSLIVVDTIQ